MFFCTSELCKSFVLLFAIVIAGYLIMTNSRSKIKEYFEEENTASITKTDIETVNKTSTQNPIISKNTECSVDPETDALISKIYKDVYKADITDDKLKQYRQKYCLNKNNFDPVIFEEAVKTDRVSELQNTVNEVFMKELDRNATPEEMDSYISAFMDGELKSKEELIRILGNSPEKVTNPTTRKQVAQSELTKEDYKLYKQIIDVFQKILDRSPNSTELNHYFTMIKTDKSFSLDKLEDALISSREHNILVRNQRNVVQGELLGNITERQMQVVISAIYKSIYQYEPDKASYTYLREKFVDFNLDEEKLIMFIKQLKSVEESALQGVSIQTSDKMKTLQNTMLSKSNGQKTDTYETFLENKPDTNKLTMEKPESTAVEEKTNNIIHKLEITNDPKAIETDKMMNNIRTNAKCSFDKNKIEKILELNDKQLYADYVNQRSQEKCSDDSSRTTRYLNADNNMVLYPQFKWSVPQPRPPVCYSKGTNYQPLVEQTALIGTLLTDARQTQLGSILPDYEYKERL